MPRWLKGGLDAMDPITMAAAAVTALSPYLIEAAKGAGGKIGEAAYESAAKLFKFLKDKLRGQDEQKALARLEQAPGDSDNQAALRVVLKEALQRDATLCNELEPLLKAVPQNITGQSMNVAGDNNVSNQAAGQGISISVGERK
jgi:hypothetical protein